MRFLLFFVVLWLLSGSSSAQAPSPRTLQQLSTFARLYGYVRYFHPSDEAVAADWDKLAVLGCERTSVPQTDSAFKATLLTLFRPLAPTLRLVPAGRHVRFRTRDIAPPDLAAYQVISWQHEGLELGARGSGYRASHPPSTASTWPLT